MQMNKKSGRGLLVSVCGEGVCHGSRRSRLTEAFVLTISACQSLASPLNRPGRSEARRVQNMKPLQQDRRSLKEEGARSNSDVFQEESIKSRGSPKDRKRATRARVSGQPTADT